MKKQWGDVRAGFWGTLARFALLKLKTHEKDPRNWRPNILVFAGNVKKRIDLVHLANYFNQRRGILTVCNMITENEKTTDFDVKKQTINMDSFLEEQGISAFSEIDVISDVEKGILNITQANGIAGLQSNTIMLGWSEKKERLVSMLKTIRKISELNKSSILARINDFPLDMGKKRIDVWWRGKHSNGDLMLLLAYLLNLNSEWKDANIVIYTVILKEADIEFMQQNLTKLLNDVRIIAEPKVIVKPKEKSVTEIIHDYSKDADIVFMGLRLPEPGEEEDYYQRLNELSEGLKVTVFVRNGEEFAGEMI
jgi:ACT domain-containing protein